MRGHFLSFWRIIDWVNSELGSACVFVTKFSVVTYEHPTSMPIQPNLALILLFLAAYVK